MVDKFLDDLKRKYSMSEVDTQGFDGIKVMGMTFNIKAYKAEGLGHISAMTAKGFLGLMRMDTLIITPLEKDLPLYSYDRIFAFGKDTLMVEMFDTMLGSFNSDELKKITDAYRELPETDPGEHWYDGIKLGGIAKKGKRKISSRLDEMAMAHFEAFLKADASDVCDLETKRSKSAYYVEGLLKNGGPSTDVFKKAIGDEKTAELFRKVLFGTNEE